MKVLGLCLDPFDVGCLGLGRETKPRDYLGWGRRACTESFFKEVLR